MFRSSVLKFPLFAVVLAVPSIYGATMFVSTPTGLSSNTSVNWSQYGVPGTTVILPNTATSSMNNKIGVDVPTFSYNQTWTVSNTCNSPTTCWSTPTPGFNNGDTLLQTGTSSGGAGNGPLTFCFDSTANVLCSNATKGIYGAGAYIQPFAVGAFTAQLQAYNGTTLLLTQSVSSDASGDPVFLGAFDGSKDITSLVFSLTAITSDGVDGPNDFAVDSLYLTTAVPEPATFFPVLLVASALAFGTRKQLARKLAKKAA